MDKEHLLNGHFEGSLTNEEQLAFGRLLESDPDFLEAYNFRNKLKTALIQSERKALKDKLRQYESRKRVFAFNWKYAAAAVLILCFGGYFLFQKAAGPQDLYAQYYEAYPNVISPIVRADPSEESLEQKAFVAYESKEFRKAVDLFSELYQSNQQEYALFYKAIAILETGEQVPAAIEIFERTNWTEAYKDKSLWYLALSYLKQSDERRAKEVLQKLAHESNYRQEQVSELLGKL